MSRRRPGLSLVEVGLIACLVGTLLAIFVPTFIDRVRTNRIAEAPELLEQLYRRTASYFETDWSGREHCLPAEAGPTPTQPSPDPQAVDFAAEDVLGHASWAALGFQPERPIRFSYRFVPYQDGCNLEGPADRPAVTFTAVGDLDGDKVHSRFERAASIDSAEGLVPVGALQVYQRVE